jgi:hypothetical protein
LCCQDGRAHLIDWDLSGSASLTLYPIGFNLDIGYDGKRHPEAVAGKKIALSHDVFAVMHLLQLFQLADPTLQETYQGIISSYSSARFTDDLAALSDKLKIVVANQPADALSIVPNWDILQNCEKDPVPPEQADENLQRSNTTSRAAANDFKIENVEVIEQVSTAPPASLSGCSTSE